MDHQLDDRLTHLGCEFNLVTAACDPNTAKATLTTLDGQIVDVLIQERTRGSSEDGELQTMEQLMESTHSAMYQRLKDGYYNEESVPDTNGGDELEAPSRDETFGANDDDTVEDSAFPRMGAQFSILEVEENPRELEEMDPEELTEVTTTDVDADECLDETSVPGPEHQGLKLTSPSLEENTAPYFEDSMAEAAPPPDDAGDGKQFRSVEHGVDDEEATQPPAAPETENHSSPDSPVDESGPTTISPAVEAFFEWGQSRDLATSIWSRNAKQHWIVEEQSQAAKKMLPPREHVSGFLADSESFSRVAADGPGPLITVWIADDRALVVLIDDDVLTVTETALGELGLTQARAREFVATEETKSEKTSSPSMVDDETWTPALSPTPEHGQGC